jgi:Na+-transporting methylmalonyl-CoA/oxaloacetate decarboxylase gamma subunit
MKEMDILTQTISIILLGVGLTFAGLGLIVLLIMALTRALEGKRRPVQVHELSAEVTPADTEQQNLEQAAIAAVVVALAAASRRANSQQAWHFAAANEGLNPWQAYNRGQLLEQRKTHQTLRW